VDWKRYSKEVRGLKGRGYDPIRLSEVVEKQVIRPTLKMPLRRYYRFRYSKHYGGIYTADAVGCNLRCVFCWSYRYITNPNLGNFYSPEEVARKLVDGAAYYGVEKVRVSGAEPTIGREHLIALIDQLKHENVLFILETNGILLSEEAYAKRIANQDNVHVRISLKGGSPSTFHKITGACEEGFELQLEAIRNLARLDANFHVSAVVSFSTNDEIRSLLLVLKDIKDSLVTTFEPELVVLYPKVLERLMKANLKPLLALTPKGEIVRM